MPKKINGFTNFVVWSNGVVKNTKTGKTIVPRVIRNYNYVDLNEGSLRKNLRLGRMVAQHFVPNPLNKPEVNHLDGNRFNDDASNLEWVTTSENQRHKIGLQKKNGTYKPPRGRMTIARHNVERVFKLRKEGYLHKEIAKKLGMGQSTVTHILLGTRRKNQ
jgi:DNA invertase Pin-like site-specific DNA recombinase